MTNKTPVRYAVFNELTDEHIPIGVFDDDQDAWIAAAEHGLREDGTCYYITRCMEHVAEDLTLNVVPICDHKFVRTLNHGVRCFYCNEPENNS